jgi:hypothetical protein
MMVLGPLENIPESRRKLFVPMSFDEKIMDGNKIKNLPIILEAKLRLMSQFSIKVYKGNTPPNHCLMMMWDISTMHLLLPRQNNNSTSDRVYFNIKPVNIGPVRANFPVYPPQNSSTHSFLASDKMTNITQQ